MSLRDDHHIYIEFLLGHIGLEYIRATGLDILNTLSNSR
jgi:hypothetical protein